MSRSKKSSKSSKSNKAANHIIGLDIGAAELASRVSFDKSTMPASAAKALYRRNRMEDGGESQFVTDGKVLVRTDLVERRWCHEMRKRPIDKSSLRTLRMTTVKWVWDGAIGNATIPLKFVACVTADDIVVAIYEAEDGRKVGYNANLIGYFANTGMTELLAYENDPDCNAAMVVRKGEKMALVMPLESSSLEAVLKAVEIAKERAASGKDGTADSAADSVAKLATV
jgi:hypothetical protein